MEQWLNGVEHTVEPRGTWAIEDKEDSYTGLEQRMTGQVGQKGGKINMI